MYSKYISLLSLIGLCACSSETPVNEPTICPDPYSQTISLDIVSSGDKASRAGRVLTSSEAANDVDVVSIALYTLGDDGAIGTKVFSRNLSWKDSVAGLQEGQMVHINLKKPRNWLLQVALTTVSIQ